MAAGWKYWEEDWDCWECQPGSEDVPSWYVVAAWPHLLSWDQRLRATRAMVHGGHLEVLQWVRQQPDCPWGVQLCDEAASRGDLRMLQWLRQQKPPCHWKESVSDNAAGGGHLEVLQWLRQQQPPCPWSLGVCLNAASGGHLEVLQWAREQQPPCHWVKWIVMANASRFPAMTAWVEAAADD